MFQQIFLTILESGTCQANPYRMNRAGWKAILQTLWQTSMVGAWTLVTAQAATVRIDTSCQRAVKTSQ